jgi:hypothetical protein
MCFEKLSQRELIWLAGVIREKKKPDSTSIYKQLNAIVHHAKGEDNPYHGQWTHQTRNRVIHQIFNKTIPEEERKSFIEEHPLEQENKFLKNEIDMREELLNYYSSEAVCNRIGMNDMENKLKEYDNVEKMDNKQIAEKFSELRKEIIIRINHLCHITITILTPLILKGWVFPEYLEIPTHRSGYGPPPGPVNFDEIGKQLPTHYYGDGIPFEGVTNEVILDVVLPPFEYVSSMNDMNGKLFVKVKELQTEIESLTEKNKNLEKDNQYLQSIIRNNSFEL